MFQIKICGVTTSEDACAAADAGADALGFNFYPRSRRHLGLEQATAIAAALPTKLARVGLFVNAPTSQITAVSDALRLDVLQLHGDETPEDVARLGKRNVMRAFRCRRGDLPAILQFLRGMRTSPLPSRGRAG